MIPLWEEFVGYTKYKQSLSFVGNLGITFVVMVLAVIGLLFPFRWMISTPLLIFLLVLFIYDVNTFVKPKILDKTVIKIVV